MCRNVRDARSCGRSTSRNVTRLAAGEMPDLQTQEILSFANEEQLLLRNSPEIIALDIGSTTEPFDKESDQASAVVARQVRGLPIVEPLATPNADGLRECANELVHLSRIVSTSL